MKIEKISDTIIFRNFEAKVLKANLHLQKPGNLRFNQVLYPNGNSDGSFGQEIEFKLDQEGEYKLIIGDSKMQGDAFGGNL